MKLILAALLTTIMFSAAAYAEKETIVLPAKNGNVEFDHKKHQEMLKSCMPCHEKAPGKIEVLGKEFGHKPVGDVMRKERQGLRNARNATKSPSVATRA